MIRSVKSGANRSLRFIQPFFCISYHPGRNTRSNMENKAKKKPVAAIVRELTESAVEECGCRLWDVEYVKDATGWNLILTIDKDEGISLDDCEMVNDAVGAILDEADPIPDSYCLEISSPGLERELRTYSHMNAFLGSAVLVRLYTAYEGSKSLAATLSSCDPENDTVTLTSDGKDPIVLERKAIAKMTVVADL